MSVFSGNKHLAISVFVFSGTKLLIQQRAAGKYHCPGRWANTCCGHPLPGESVTEAANRRLGEEVGVAPFRRHLEHDIHQLSKRLTPYALEPDA